MSDNTTVVNHEDDVLYDDFNRLTTALREAADYIDKARDAGVIRPPLTVQVTPNQGTEQPFVNMRLNEYLPAVLASWAEWAGAEVRVIDHGITVTRSFVVQLASCRVQVGTQVSTIRHQR